MLSQVSFEMVSYYRKYLLIQKKRVEQLLKVFPFESGFEPLEYLFVPHQNACLATA